MRDLLVVKNDLHNYLVTGSMDKKVFIWDLDTLDLKLIKTGHLAGVQCLAFDGRSILYGGGFDYRIIGWDLDNVLDIPVFTLVGHTTPILKVVPNKGADRCFSLDESGEIRFWETSIYSPIDKEERQIDAVSVLEDHLRTVEVFSKAGAAFDTMHGLVHTIYDFLPQNKTHSKYIKK